MSRRHLVYELELDDGWLHIRAQGMDCAGERPDVLATVVDDTTLDF
jgi:hypothetical protein